MNQLSVSVCCLLCCSIIFVSTALCSLIIHGRDANDGEVPFQVGLLSLTKELRCGGVILSQNWILTTGYCASFGGRKLVIYNTLNISNGDIVQIERSHSHPNFTLQTDLLLNDIGLIRTATPMKLDRLNAKPVKLPSSNNHLEDGILVVSGWGNTLPGYQDTKLSTNRLQIVSVPVIDDAKCAKLLQQEYLPFLKNEMMCVGEMVDQAKGQCLGDSGGPGTVNGVLQGIVSWRTFGCINRPSVLTRVTPYLDWIRTITGIQKNIAK